MKALDILKKIINIADYGRYQEEREDIEEAIKELEELNNRSCESCKWFTYYKEQSSLGECFGGARELSDIDTCDKDFCCNKYEPKQ